MTRRNDLGTTRVQGGSGKLNALISGPGKKKRKRRPDTIPQHFAPPSKTKTRDQLRTSGGERKSIPAGNEYIGP